MKTFGHFLLAAAWIFSLPASARQTSDTITVTGTRFTFPLVQEWYIQTAGQGHLHRYGFLATHPAVATVSR
ncbi:hypothetical protein SAMN04488128_10167 [Chitinophaga eiseniae]|uniref:IPT/TIG domain-containing protein n=1 Tax=Chitinophaga eiseniae TaxID=634771 RepID=A0A1T4KD49_9BACT|nr:hypothetical protein [Chitinophaga eiseniae]SJZ40316.1 hypothetical protein SAMN04488128_10167 [Chitinophaga eiseniae]